MSGVQAGTSDNDTGGPEKRVTASVSVKSKGLQQLWFCSFNLHPSASNKYAQAVQDFVGYNPRPLLFAVYVLLAILTGGLLWVMGQLFPRTMLWTMAKCPLSHAQYVHAKVQLINRTA